ncbi:proteasome ATPase [Luteococcus peritonei]|uniref:AAA ATPase forming ring-shaped complexes n=1 Tax=Luteococcus peritonei TaxID=88874 RepID=A0ABW4RUC9_9ACTN
MPQGFDASFSPGQGYNHRLEVAERRMNDARADARNLAQQNEKLNQTLREARQKLVTLKAEVDALSRAPLNRALVVHTVAAEGEQAAMLEVSVFGRLVRVAALPEVVEAAGVGDAVLLNESTVAVALADPMPSGELAVVVEAGPGGVVVGSPGGEESLLLPVPELAADPPQAGQSVLVDRRAGLALGRVARSEVEELVLEEVPDVCYADIGGLGEQIEQIRDAVELPFLQREAYRRYQLTAPKGILLYGPPGCGKTMIAKAVANSLGAGTDGRGGSYFLNIKGPELLNKYVGESERQIRAIFARAREHAGEGKPVIVFFDEMDSLFRTRGSGVSSDVENTVVPQLLSEIDGVEGIDNVIIIGASNREDMIDPAILRPGRLDVKIKLERPSREGAREIFAKYLTPETPLHPDVAGLEELVELAVATIYDRTEENRFLEVTYASGDKEVLWFSDFASGAMVRNVVDRAKKAAIKDELAGGPGGVSREGIVAACRAEYTENEDLPNTTNPDDWARISGRKGERIVFIRSLVHQRARELD